MAKKIGEWNEKEWENKGFKQDGLFDKADGYLNKDSPKFQSYQSCYHSHKPLQVGEYVVYGGSCISPAVNDADIYVGFDHGMKLPSHHYPWEGKSAVLYPITDTRAPTDAASFKKLISWLVEQLKAGKKVHLGCIGGHGRTGTALAALVMEITGNKDAITYVREQYCKKAVESSEQVEFLHQHYGIKAVEGSKLPAPAPVASKGSNVIPYAGKGSKASGAGTYYSDMNKRFPAGRELEDVQPVKKTGNMWGKALNLVI